MSMWSPQGKEMLWRRAPSDNTKAYSSHSNRSSIITPWLGNFSSIPRYSCTSGACLASLCLGSPLLWTNSDSQPSTPSPVLKVGVTRMVPGFFLLGSFLALAHELLCTWVRIEVWLCSSGGLQSQVGTRALLSSSPVSPGSVRCTALPYTALAPRTAQLSLQSQPTSEAVERELEEDISTIHTWRVSSVHRPR